MFFKSYPRTTLVFTPRNNSFAFFFADSGEVLPHQPTVTCASASILLWPFVGLLTGSISRGNYCILDAIVNAIDCEKDVDQLIVGLLIIRRRALPNMLLLGRVAG